MHPYLRVKDFLGVFVQVCRIISLGVLFPCLLAEIPQDSKGVRPHRPASSCVLCTFLCTARVLDLYLASPCAPFHASRRVTGVSASASYVAAGPWLRHGSFVYETSGERWMRSCYFLDAVAPESTFDSTLSNNALAVLHSSYVLSSAGT